MEQKVKGSRFLNITGILMIIGGALMMILSLIAIVGIAALAYLSDGEISSSLLYGSGALALVSAVVQLVAGIMGVKYCNRPDKAGTCMGWGIAVAVLFIISMVLNYVGGGEFKVVSLATGLIIPVLYIIGAYKNMKQAKTFRSQLNMEEMVANQFHE